MGKQKTCCVTGHCKILVEQADIISKYLRQKIITAIEDGHTHFFSGFAVRADLLFAKIVVELKEICLVVLEVVSLPRTHENTRQDIPKAHPVLRYCGDSL